jgi:hypothetical protein
VIRHVEAILSEPLYILSILTGYAHTPEHTGTGAQVKQMLCPA